jgi:hypothetical protein
MGNMVEKDIILAMYSSSVALGGKGCKGEKMLQPIGYGMVGVYVFEPEIPKLWLEEANEENETE